MQERVHEQEMKLYDAAQLIRPDTVARSILHVIDLPADATIYDLTIRPMPHHEPVETPCGTCLVKRHPVSFRNLGRLRTRDVAGEVNG
jgi:hypothetical protein